MYEDKNQQESAVQEAEPTVQEASVEKAAIVKATSEEQPQKQLSYQDFLQKIEQLEKQIRETSPPEEDVENLAKKVTELETQVAKITAKKRSGKKASNDAPEANQQPTGKTDSKEENTETAEAENASDERFVAVDEIRPEDVRKESWFKDLLKANKKLIGFHG